MFTKHLFPQATITFKPLLSRFFTQTLEAELSRVDSEVHSRKELNSSLQERVKSSENEILQLNEFLRDQSTQVANLQSTLNEMTALLHQKAEDLTRLQHAKVSCIERGNTASNCMCNWLWNCYL